MARIRFDNVEKRFGEVIVVKDLNLTIEEGEFFTFVGPSGCGKSTLLNLIAGIESLTSGRLYFDDDIVNELAPAQRDVAMVFQNYALYPHMTVRENLAFPLKNKSVERRRIVEAVQRVASTLGLEALLDRKPRALSGGQRQRVALGRALIRQPRVFLMDEPLSNLDARLRLEMREELKRLHGDYQITTVYVTHDQEEAMALSERVAVLDQGRIQQLGKPETVYEQPKNLFVAGFIGSPPINILPGELLRDVPFFNTLLGPFRDPISVGMRPADIAVDTEKLEDALAAEVLLLEPTGSDLWVVGRWRGHKIKGRARQGARFERGRQAFFGVPLERVYLFDRHSGSRLAVGRD